ncbi:DUF6082 family protein [Streptomyces coeruleofuscus]|uniref:DUF6082 family protein n=1 Tax=Streptomyces coeruleofuscus TaxID=66879 RepID=UPI0031F9B806
MGCRPRIRAAGPSLSSVPSVPSVPSARLLSASPPIRAARHAGRRKRRPPLAGPLLFASALYTNALCYYRMGSMTREEFFGFARSMLQNPAFRE